MSAAKPVAWFASTLGVTFAHVDKARVDAWVGSDGDCAEPIPTQALVFESDYLAERKAREAAEAKSAELNSINSKLCEMMDEELENAKEWEAKAEAAEADARRYRWLRERFHATDFAWGNPPINALIFEWSSASIDDANFDAAVDAATQEAKK